ncbi:ArsR/SmtB family transcription factor [Corynebacterium freneyi]
MKTEDDGLAFAASIAAECSSPVRLMILRLLLEEGESRVRIMAEQLGVGESTLSNHLKRLRDAGIVGVTRSGRTATYRLADPRVGEVVASLLGAAGLAPEYPALDADSGLAHARSCYDHLAGEVGVKLTRGLVDKRAIVVDGDVVDVGPNAEKCFARLGAGLTGLPAGRKRSFMCDDWSHGDKHLAGALGAVLLQGLISKRFVESVPGSRELAVTPAGEAIFAEFYTA